MIGNMAKNVYENESLRYCKYQNWYKDLKKIAIPTKCLKIPKTVVTYLLDALIILPKECNPKEPVPSTSSKCEHVDENIYENNDEDDNEEPEFPEFSQQITNAIQSLGGASFIKTNWNSPKDSFWITPGQTLRCQDITDVYLLLKASSICKEDLLTEIRLTESDNNDESDQEYVEDNCLVLRKWIDIHPGTEFRCFVKSRQLIAISPRDWPQYHEHHIQQKANIIIGIRSTYREHIKTKCPLNDYVFDVIMTGKEDVYLMDISPYGSKYCESLAFEWDELDKDIPSNLEEDDPEFRFLTTECGIQPRKKFNYGIPKDIVDMFQSDESTSALDELLFDRMRMREPDDNRF